MDSRSRTAARALFWVTLSGIAFVTLSPIADRPETPFGPDAERFCAFALVSGLAMLAYPGRRALLLGAIVLAAAALEASQGLVSGRHGRVADFEVKSCGALAGAALALACRRALAGREPPRA